MKYYISMKHQVWMEHQVQVTKITKQGAETCGSLLGFGRIASATYLLIGKAGGRALSMPFLQMEKMGACYQDGSHLGCFLCHCGILYSSRFCHPGPPEGESYLPVESSVNLLSRDALVEKVASFQLHEERLPCASWGQCKPWLMPLSSLV